MHIYQPVCVPIAEPFSEIVIVVLSLRDFHYLSGVVDHLATEWIGHCTMSLGLASNRSIRIIPPPCAIFQAI
jgi:hypothetical protein